MDPKNFEKKEGDLLECEEEYIAHQCNCVTNVSMGLARKIFDRFPHANTYEKRQEPSEPGTIDAMGGEGGERGVINMYSQFKQGKQNAEETREKRLEYFDSCLEAVPLLLPGMKSIAFPHGYGCGLAGGKWEDYEPRIVEFARKHPGTRVVIYEERTGKRKGGSTRWEPPTRRVWTWVDTQST